MVKRDFIKYPTCDTRTMYTYLPTHCYLPIDILDYTYIYCIQLCGQKTVTTKVIQIIILYFH